MYGNSVYTWIIHAVENGESLCGGENECCSFSRQCTVGDGDCDSDSECASELICGTNNCNNIKELALSHIPMSHKLRSKYVSANFSATDDCCWYETELAEFAIAMLELNKELGDAGFQREMNRRLEEAKLQG